MPSYNKVIMIGHLTRDPEAKELPSGQNLASMGLAVNETYKDKDKTCFIDVTVWGKTADNVAKYMSKGSAVMVEGRLQYDTWEKDGVKRSKHSLVAERVVFLPKGEKRASAGGDSVVSEIDDARPVGEDGLPF